MKLSYNFLQRLWYSILFTFAGCGIVMSITIPALQWIFGIGCLLIHLFALKEFFHIAKKESVAHLDYKSSYFLSSMAYIIHFFTYKTISVSAIAVMYLLILTLVSSLRHFVEIKNAITDVALTLFGATYITIPLLFLIDLGFMTKPLAFSSFSTQHTTYSPFWLVATVMMTKGSDMAAYFTGKSLGNHLLAPCISPKKTIEGAIGGLFGSFVACFCAVYLFFGVPNTTRTICGYGILALITGAVSQISDLIESLFKRAANVKDSSSSIPGLGGVLDIFDSLLFTLPVVYYLLQYI